MGRPCNCSIGGIPAGLIGADPAVPGATGLGAPFPPAPGATGTLFAGIPLRVGGADAPFDGAIGAVTFGLCAGIPGPLGAPGAPGARATGLTPEAGAIPDA